MGFLNELERRLKKGVNASAGFLNELERRLKKGVNASAGFLNELERLAYIILSHIIKLLLAYAAGLILALNS